MQACRLFRGQLKALAGFATKNQLACMSVAVPEPIRKPDIKFAKVYPVRLRYCHTSFSRVGPSLQGCGKMRNATDNLRIVFRLGFGLGVWLELH